jgi:hypothetical protein
MEGASVPGFAVRGQGASPLDASRPSGGARVSKGAEEPLHPAYCRTQQQHVVCGNAPQAHRNQHAIAERWPTDTRPPKDQSLRQYQ